MPKYGKIYHAFRKATPNLPPQRLERTKRILKLLKKKSRKSRY